MKIILGPTARADLADIAQWIARDNPTRAQSFIDELEQKCAGLSSHPLRFPIVRRGAGFVIRKRVHGHYLIFYQLFEAHIEVMRIVHSARDWTKLINGDEIVRKSS